MRRGQVAGTGNPANHKFLPVNSLRGPTWIKMGCLGSPKTDPCFCAPNDLAKYAKCIEYPIGVRLWIINGLHDAAVHGLVGRNHSPLVITQKAEACELP